MLARNVNRIFAFSLLTLVILVALTWIEAVFGASSLFTAQGSLNNMTLFLILFSAIAICCVIFTCYLSYSNTQKHTGENVPFPAGLQSYQTLSLIQPLHDILREKHDMEAQFMFHNQLLESIQESIIVIKTDSEIVYCNEKAKRVFGITNTTTSVKDINLPFNEKADTIIETLQAGQVWEEEGHIIKNEQTRTFLHRFQPLHTQHCFNIVIISTDISDLTEARIHAETANMAKSQFLANMTHELRTPMVGILGSADFLEKTPLNPEQMENLHIIQDCSRQLLDIINEILDVSKIELGIENLTNTATDVADLLHKTVRMTETKLREKGLLLEVDIAPSIPRMLMVDKLKLRQVVANLIYNAIKFTPQGGIRLEAKMEELEHCTFLSVSVADTGIGIPQSQLKSIFNRFEQGNSKACREYGGTGLGLYICQKHIELMSGQIWADSIEGVGSTFSFRIPVQIVNDEESLLETANTATLAAACSLDNYEFDPIRVLVVEDNELNQKLLVQMLSNYGFEVFVSNNGLNCINMLQSDNFDVILMDMQMPVMDGYEATRLIRENPDWEHIPVIAITANAMSGDREKCLACGCSSYLAKPFKAEELINEIKTYLKAEFINNRRHKNNSSALSNQLIADLIPEFIELMQEMLVDLTGAIETKNLAEVQNLGHAIKGTAGMYGFMNMSEIAACIEQSAKDKNLHKLVMLHTQLTTLFNQLSRPVSNVIG